MLDLRHFYLIICIAIGGNIRNINCSHEKRNVSVAGISLIQKTPFRTPNQLWEIQENYYDVYYYKDIVMYKFNYVFDS